MAPPRCLVCAKAVGPGTAAPPAAFNPSRIESAHLKVPKAYAGSFRSLSLMSAFKVAGVMIRSAKADSCRRKMRRAGGRTRRRRLNKLSCAGWLPHDRGFVSGLPHSKGRASVRRPAHNRREGSPPWSCLQRCAP